VSQQARLRPRQTVVRLVGAGFKPALCRNKLWCRKKRRTHMKKPGAVSGRASYTTFSDYAFCHMLQFNAIEIFWIA
jgi:hypothetical protein